MQYVLCNFRTLKCLNGVSLYSYSFQLACLFSHCLVNCYQPQLGKQFFTANRAIDHPSSRPVDRDSQRPKPLFLVLLETNVESKKNRNFRVDTETKKTAKLWSIFFTKIWYCRVRLRFFDQVGHQTTNASIRNKYFFTK